MGNSHEFHNMSLFLWQWGVNCAVLPYIKFPNNENPFPEKRELSLLNPAII